MYWSASSIGAVWFAFVQSKSVEVRSFLGRMGLSFSTLHISSSSSSSLMSIKYLACFCWVNGNWWKPAICHKLSSISLAWIWSWYTFWFAPLHFFRYRPKLQRHSDWISLTAISPNLVVSLSCIKKPCSNVLACDCNSWREEWSSFNIIEYSIRNDFSIFECSIQLASISSKNVWTLSPWYFSFLCVNSFKVTPLNFIRLLMRFTIEEYTLTLLTLFGKHVATLLVRSSIIDPIGCSPAIGPNMLQVRLRNPGIFFAIPNTAAFTILISSVFVPLWLASYSYLCAIS